MKAKSRVGILLVEDSESDAHLAREALREARGCAIIYVATDGIDAMAYLRREGEHAAALRPDVVLLDLNMPRKDGREVLAEMKSDSTLKSIPVIVFTTSDAPADVNACYNNSCSCYVTKPMEWNEFMRAFQLLDDFWTDAVQLPAPNK